VKRGRRKESGVQRGGGVGLGGAPQETRALTSCIAGPKHEKGKRTVKRREKKRHRTGPLSYCGSDEAESTGTLPD